MKDRCFLLFVYYFIIITDIEVSDVSVNSLKSRDRSMDMTSGSIFPKIIRFTLPLLLMGTLQLLYNAADIVVVGRWGSDASLAAVSSTGALINLIVNVFMGLSVGTSVVVAQHFGAGRMKDVSETVHTSIAVAAISGIAVGVFGFFAAKGMLELMDSPENVIDLSALYVKIYFIGMPANMLYNFGAAVLRAVGDTKRPLYYLSISGVINVILNLIFVIAFKMDVAGVALATIISQVVSAVLVLACLMHSDGAIKLYVKKLRIHKDKLINILSVGLPAGIQGSIFSISNVIIQSSINFFGDAAMAGSGAGANIEGFIYMAMNSVYQAAITFTSQNFGAEKYRRIKTVAFECMGLVTAVGLSLGIIVKLFDTQLLSIYTDVQAEIEFGVIRMSVILLTYFLDGTMDVMVGLLRGIGHSVLPTVGTIAFVCGFRMLWIFTFFAQYKASVNNDPAKSLTVLFLSYPISWIMATLSHTICFLVIFGKIVKKAKAEGKW